MKSLFKKLSGNGLHMYVFLYLVFVAVRLPRLGSDIINIDAPLWNDRITSFYTYLKTFNFEQTYRTFHPGVTLMWVSGFGLEVFRQIYRLRNGFWPSYNDSDVFPLWNFSMKLPVILLLGFLFVFSYWAISKLWGKKSALLFYAVLFLEPHFLGNNRLVHLDSLHAMFAFSSILSLLLFLKGEAKFLLLSSFFSALTFLTRASGIFVPLGMISILFFHFVPLSKRPLKGKLGLFVKNCAIYASIFFLTLYAFFPASYKDPFGVYGRVFGESFNLSKSSHAQVWLGQATQSPPNLFYLASFAFNTTPMFFILSVLALFALIGSGRLFLDKNILYMFLYAALFTSIIFISNKKIPRYLLTLFPVLALFQAMFLSGVYRMKKKIVYLALCLLLVFQASAYIRFFPDFIAYASPMFGGMRVREKYIGNKHFGYGLKQVADYLNSKNDAENIVLVFSGYGSIDPFLKGSAKQESYFWGYDLSDIDYYLKPYYNYRSEDDENEDIWSQVKGGFTLEKKFKVGNMDYWELYKSKESLR